MPRRHRFSIGVAVAIGLTLVSLRVPIGAQTAAALPDRLTDTEFWALTQTLSEPDGTMQTSFQSDNLVSNESGFQKVLPALTERHPAGGVYLGVGPEQNFTYIAALKPRVAFIVDLRRGNRDLHLMYKALFELAADRADFVSLLFSRARPTGLTDKSSASEIFAAVENAEAAGTRFDANLAQITGLLTTRHGWPLSADDLRGIERIYGHFFRSGPGITYGSSRATSPANASAGFMQRLSGFGGSYASLMQETDANNEPRSYLSSEERFAVMKNLQARNLVVPIVGNFSGPKALRAVGDWIRTRRATVSAFYLSNVEDYLQRDNAWTAFCQNVVTLPIDDASDFIRSGGKARPQTPPAATDATGAPTVRGVSFRTTSMQTDGSGTVVVMFSDGTRRQMTETEAAKLLPLSWGVPGNALASIAAETKACRGAGTVIDRGYLPATPNNSR